MEDLSNNLLLNFFWETLVEADKPQLPMVIENQDCLNHLCPPHSFLHQLLPESLSFHYNLAILIWNYFWVFILFD